MTDSIRVLHISSHLGGGIGRVMSTRAAYSQSHADGIEDVFISLEAPQDARYADLIAASGARLIVAPDEAHVRREIEGADITQLEWWHHPLMAKWATFLGSVSSRWVVWAHVSGLHYPSISPAFSGLPHAFLTTTPATLRLLEQEGMARDNLVDFISSTGGFEDFPLPDAVRDPARSCYLGSLNPAKMHPNIMAYAQGVGRPDFQIDIFGDSSVNPQLEHAVRRLGAQSPIKLCGFCDRPQDVLPTYALFPYLLNPTHYGSTENALLEAMACGCVPLVMNNAIESGIVRHGVTGFVVDGIESFAATVRFLLDHPDECRRIGEACAKIVRREYSVAASAQKFLGIYRAVAEKSKKTLAFSSVFGKTAADMFLSCLGEYSSCFSERDGEAQRARRLALPFLYERSKSSVFQFCRYFPDDRRLASWEKMLLDDEASLYPQPQGKTS